MAMAEGRHGLGLALALLDVPGPWISGGLRPRWRGTASDPLSSESLADTLAQFDEVGGHVDDPVAVDVGPGHVRACNGQVADLDPVGGGDQAIAVHVPRQNGEAAAEMVGEDGRPDARLRR